MHVLYIHQHFSTPKGSFSTRSYEFARALIDSGHSVTMVCGTNKMGNTGLQTKFVGNLRWGIVDEIKVIEIDIPYSNYENFISRAKKFIYFSFKASLLALKLKYDMIFTTSTPLTVAIPGIVARWLRRKPFVFEIRDLWPELPKAMGVINNRLILLSMALLEWLAYHSARHCIGLSPGIIDGIQRKGIAIEKTTLIPNGCDTKFFSESRKISLKGFDRNDFIAVFTGAHGIANGLDNILDAAIALKEKKASHIKLLFIGDGKTKPSLLQRVREEQLDNCIFWPPIAKEELRNVLKSVDIGMMVLANIPAFYYGTSPNKFFDYIASGLPVLNNYPGWLSELLAEYHCGVSVPPADTNSFAQTLIDLASDEKRLENMAKQTRNLSNDFDRRELATKFVNVLEKAYG